MSRVLWLCFALSGAAALGMELLWMRSAGLVLGATASTAATVLGGYFAGLALGAAAGRRAPARPVRRYALLELCAAAGAVWSLAVFHMLNSEWAVRALAPGGLPARIAAVAIAILPATACLGATLPVLGQALVGSGAVGRRGGLLYAVNTLGGAVGIALMGFSLPAVLGVTASYLAVAAVSALAGLLALGVGEVGSAPATVRAPGAAIPSRLRAVAAGAGALGLGLEVLWTRLFAQVLHNSVYSFAAVSLVFVLALAMGAALGAGLVRRHAPAAVAAGALLAAGVATIAGFWLFVRATDGLAYVGMRTGLGEYLARVVALAALTAGPAALASGVVLPALWGTFGTRGDAARPLGDLSAANLVGGIGGALVAGFVALPSVGLRATLLVAAVAYVVLADVVGAPRGLRSLAYAALLGFALLDPARAPLAHLAPGERLRDVAEGADGIVSVVETRDDLQLRLDNYYVLGGTAAATNERRQGLLPLLLHPAPEHVAFIGMATGISASAGPALGVEDVTVVELVPEVAAAARTHFGPWNGHLLERPGVRLVVDDGRRHLAAARGRYDVIVSDLFIPWHAGATSLYAREMFEAGARRLVPRGLFCQWLPLYQLTREEFELIARTFMAVFPHVQLWRDDFYADRPVVGLVGTRAPAPLDVERLGVRLARLPGWSRDPMLESPRGIAMLYLGELSAAPDLVPPGALNTDDHPLIEFLAPRLTRVGPEGDKDWFVGEPLAQFTEALAAYPGGFLPATASLADAQQAGRALFRYALAARRGDSMAAAGFEGEVRRLVPEVVASGEHDASAASLADARRALGALETEQEHVREQLDAMESRLRALTRSPGDGR